MPKTTAIVIAPKNFQEEELQVIRDLLRWYGIRTLVVAKTRGLAVGSRGTELEPDLAIGELAAQPVDALVFVDGEGIVDYYDDLAVYRAIHQAQLGRKILAAINDAPLVLANAGALIGRTVTAAPAHEQLLRLLDVAQVRGFKKFRVVFPQFFFQEKPQCLLCHF